MRIDEILNCSFERWYPQFKHLTFKSEIIPVPDQVLTFLRSDSTIILPKSCQKELDLVLKKGREERIKDYDTDSEEDEFCQHTDEEFPDFPDFDKQIKESLSRFGGRVFIKLNWSSPRDAFWSVNKTFCESLSDVYILLRSSDFINHDLNHPFDGCEPSSPPQIPNYYLVFRRWANINPMMEFRCFVRDNKLIGVSQRECRSFYQHLVDHKETLLSRVEQFFADNIREKFFDKSFTFDVYLQDDNKVKLVDFNPFGSRTDSLLYSWDELNTMTSPLELRVLDAETGVQTSELSMYGCPLESLTAAGLDSDALVSLVKKNVDLQSKDDSDDNE